MDKKLAKIIKQEVENKAYVPGDWVGVSEIKTVRLDDVLQIIDKYTEEDEDDLIKMLVADAKIGNIREKVSA